MCAPASPRFGLISHGAVKTALLILLALACMPAPARADGVFGAQLGYFMVRGQDGRPAGDVISENTGFLTFDVGDFNNVTVGGEFMLGFGRFVEAGVGVNYYQRSVPTIYTDFVGANGAEVEQNLKLRLMPVSFTARVFPTGRDAGVQPYIGGGVALVKWRYSEFGDFIDFNTILPDGSYDTFSGTFTDDGTEAAPVVFGGVRFAASDNVFIGGEFRWQGGEASLEPSLGYAGDRLSLGGYTAAATFHVRF